MAEASPTGSDPRAPPEVRIVVHTPAPGPAQPPQEFGWAPHLPGVGIPVPKYSGEFTWRESFIRDWQTVNALYLANRAHIEQPRSWALIQGMADWFVGEVSGNLCPVPCDVCGTDTTIAEQWEVVREEVASDRRRFYPRFVEFATRKMAAHGYGPKDDSRVLPPVPRETLDLLAITDPAARTGNEYRGPIWLANRIFEAARGNRLGLTVFQTRRNYFAYRSGKTWAWLQVAVLVSELLYRAGLAPRRFDARYDVVYHHDTARLRRLYYDHTRFRTWGVDEISEVLHRRDAGKAEQKEIVKYFPEKPKERQPIFVAGPHYTRFDKEWWKGIMLLVEIVPPREGEEHLPRRAIVYEQLGGDDDDNPFTETAKVRFGPLPFAWAALYNACEDFVKREWKDDQFSPLDDVLDGDPDHFMDLLQRASVEDYIAGEERRSPERLALPPPPDDWQPAQAPTPPVGRQRRPLKRKGSSP